ncbi:MAG: UDP-2,4-diacetamido-2,4,6-trideoxy-beta-L-altropyranose hydrolase [Alphaproteobacteria bacterium]|nr:UDP-2,4-diacetamido-2,4,6-trideoxy-beta-L-altropyranose hydrolase [Alphaproteobacteria bacterium]
MREAVFRVDAAPQIGGGHVVRCLALAAALAETGWKCHFLVAAGTSATVAALARSGHVVREGEASWPAAAAAPELLIVDHYGLDAAWEHGWRGRAGRILVIDDLADRPHDCDLLLDQGLSRAAGDYAGLTPPGCRFLLGPGYALLRPEFAARRDAALARRDGGPVRRVLIAPGATDPTNIAAPLIDAAEAIPDAAIDVAIGPAAPHLPALQARAAASPRLRLHIDVPDMAGLMGEADLCLGAGGGSSWERCCLGLPSLICVAGPDQARQAEALVGAGAAGRTAIDDAAALRAAVLALAADGPRRAAMSAAAARLCDGRGAARVAGTMSLLSTGC